MRRSAAILSIAAAAVLAHRATAQNVSGTEPNRGGEVHLDADDPEHARSQLVLADGYRVNLWASEVDFPDLQNPVAFAWDGRNRLWVATMPSYPQYDPGQRDANGRLGPDDKILILEDTDGDGVADRQTVFASGLHVPTGIELGDGGAYVAQQPNLMFLADTDGDDVADVRRIVLHGFGTEDSHHAISAFTWGPGGGLYFQEGTFHHTQVETPWGPVRCENAGVYRYEPTTEKLSVFVSYNFANPWGHVFDGWGQSFVADASGGANYYATAFSGHVDYPRKHPGMRQFTTTTVRPTAGCEIVSSGHFPPTAQGNWLLDNCIGFHGIKQYQVRVEDSGFLATEIEPLLFSKDINFRPVDLEFGPDGALYVCDWFNPLIGHMQYSLRDPRRDHRHGRIWRITAVDRPLLQPVDVAELSVRELLDRLRVHEDRARQRARLELRNRDAAEVLSTLDDWVAALDPEDPGLEHQLTEALWVCQNLDEVRPDLLGRVLRASDYRARAAGARVLQHWRDRVDDSIFKVSRLVRDPSPRVRLEGVRACSFYRDAAAAEVALQVLQSPMDEYLDYTLRETIVTLKPYLMPVLERGEVFCEGNEAGQEYVMDLLEPADFHRMVRTEPVCRALLTRAGIEPAYRIEAMGTLAAMRGTEPIYELIAAIDFLDKSDTGGLDDLLTLLLDRPNVELARAAPQLSLLATVSRTWSVREAAMAAMVVADGNPDRALGFAGRSLGGLRDFASAVHRVPNQALRETMYPTIRELTAELPDGMADEAGGAGRYVRIELSPRGTLTLAEVEVFVGDDNVARRGTATQSSVAWQGDPGRAIDGNTDGSYGRGTSTHTVENEAQPWWELDLGDEVPIDRIRIWNRTDGTLGQRLDGFRLTILDEQRQPVVVFDDNRAPRVATTLTIGDPEQGVREAAIRALAGFPGHAGEIFELLAPRLAEPRLRAAVAATLHRLEPEACPEEVAARVVGTIVDYLPTIGIENRGEPLFETSAALGTALANVLPPAKAAAMQAMLADLDRTVIRIAAVPAVMRFDRTQFTVVAGKPVQLTLSNPDMMQHNLLITTPGSLATVGQAAERMAARPDAFERHFVPEVPEVLFATELVNPKQEATLDFVAPDEPGDYPFVCTFPGHWRTMNGVMKVVPPQPR